MSMFYVVDVRDDFVLFAGSEGECDRVVDEGCGGLLVVGYWDLTPGMISSLPMLGGRD